MSAFCAALAGGLLTLGGGGGEAFAEALPAPPISAPSISAAPATRTAHEQIGAAPESVTASVAPAPSALPAVGAAHPSTPSSNLDRFGNARLGADDEIDWTSFPGRLADPTVRDLWRRGIAAERAERLVASAELYELIVGFVPEESFTYWRIARNYWRAGESLPADDKVGRIAYFELSESWAGRGISIDPECAPCMLWKFVSMGRQATTRGLLTAVRDVREMDELLTRGIALKPDHRDNSGNATLGNLYYAGAVFYRVMPDWWWLRIFVGVKGDKDRSLEYARSAVEVSPIRVDYRVELGAVLLCLGSLRDDSERLEEGLEVLRLARGLDDYLSTDGLDKSHARTLMASPQLACGYSRDGFIDIDSLKDEARAHR